jgi:hypothetical protein
MAANLDSKASLHRIFDLARFTQQPLAPELLMQ